MADLGTKSLNGVKGALFGSLVFNDLHGVYNSLGWENGDPVVRPVVTRAKSATDESLVATSDYVLGRVSREDLGNLPGTFPESDEIKIGAQQPAILGSKRQVQSQI